jgi:hypothetical protein
MPSSLVHPCARIFTGKQRRILSHMVYRAGAIDETGTIVDLGIGGILFY